MDSSSAAKQAITLDHVLFFSGVSPRGLDDLLGSPDEEQQHTTTHQPKPSADFTTVLSALATSPAVERASSHTVEDPPRPQRSGSAGSQPPTGSPGRQPPPQQHTAEPSEEQLPQEMHARWLQLLAAKKHVLEQVQHMREEALGALDSMRRTLTDATDRYVRRRRFNSM